MKNKLLNIPAVFTIFLIIFIFSIVQPEHDKLSENKINLESVNKKIKSAFYTENMLKALNTGGINEYFFKSEKDFSEVIKNIIQRNNIKVINESFDKKDSNEYYIEAEGSYTDIFEVLYSIESSAKYLFIKNMNLFPLGNGRLYIKLKIDYIILD